MRYGSVCSGIEAATVAWHPLGWRPAFFSEIEKFPCAVLAHRWPGVPIHGDFTTIRGDEYGAIELLVGGTPCQDFSVAGLRAGIAGERGNLTLEFLRLARRTRPRWVVWENVPGVLSIDGGRTFGTFLGGLGELGYGFAYRILDAQFFGVAQRRSRVFVVGYLGNWRRAAAVFFERESLCGHPPPSREARKDVAPTLSARTKGGGGLGTDFDCDGGLIASGISPTLRAGGNTTGGDRPPGTDVDTADWLIVMASGQANDEIVRDGSPSLTCLHEAPIVARESAIPLLEVGKRTGVSTIDPRAGMGVGKPGDPMFTLQRGAQQQTYIQSSTNVRRLTPRECERLQGFPDDYTLISFRGKPAADGPRYKALGNSMAVPVMLWIGERIALVERLSTGGKV